ncbi:glycosyltransferase family 39 protein [Chloroflexi bacterium TSY]|nr:glycosyltransferase family 39 protein [Chloroflexi bacterium TSY]
MQHRQQYIFWFFLALVGQAVSLQLIDSGPVAGYQHYYSLNQFITETNPMWLLGIAVQSVLVLAGFANKRQQIIDWLRQSLRLWQIIGIVLLFASSSAAVSRNIFGYLVELPFATYIQFINLANIVLFAWTIPTDVLERFTRFFDRLLSMAKSDHTTRSNTSPFALDRVAIFAAIWVTFLALTLNFFSYQSHPHIPDEVVYLYHARYLAEGMLTVPAPPVPEAFSFYMIPYAQEQWYSIFPPGWPAILALAMPFNIPWLVNPILLGISMLLAFSLLLELYDRRMARTALLLLSTSPWFIFMGMNFMAHMFTTVCALAATLGIVRARRTDRIGWAWLAGGAVGAVSLIRPLDGLLMAVLLGLWAIGLGGKRLKLTSLMAFGLGTILVGALVLPYNLSITGSMTTFPLSKYYVDYFGPKANALGFGSERGLGWAIDAFPGHSPFEAIINSSLNVFSINIELFGWSTGSLILVLLLIFSGRWQKKDYLWFAPIVLIPMVYGLYWFNGGPDFGARYWYLVLIPLVVLTIRGMQQLSKQLANNDMHSGFIDPRVMVAVLSLGIFSLINFSPWRAVDKYYHYRGMQPGITELAQQHSFGSSLVLIRGNSDDYQSTWLNNPLDPFAEVPIYAWDQGPEIRAKLAKAYTERPVWIVDGPSVTGTGFTLIEGPITSLQLAAME